MDLVLGVSYDHSFFFSSIECRMIIVGINLPNAMMD